MLLGLFDILAVRIVGNDTLKVSGRLISLFFDLVCDGGLVQDLVHELEVRIFVEYLAIPRLCSLEAALFLVDRENVVVICDEQIVKAKIVLHLVQTGLSLGTQDRVRILLQ